VLEAEVREWAVIAAQCPANQVPVDMAFSYFGIADPTRRLNPVNRVCPAPPEPNVLSAATAAVVRMWLECLRDLKISLIVFCPWQMEIHRGRSIE